MTYYPKEQQYILVNVSLTGNLILQALSVCFPSPPAPSGITLFHSVTLMQYSLVSKSPRFSFVAIFSHRLSYQNFTILVYFRVFI